VGTEHEKVGLRTGTFEPIAYAGEKGLSTLLRTVAGDHGFEPLYEGQDLVGVERGWERITLEPGGQLELSGAPLASLHETCREFRDHLALMKHVSGELGISWIGLGLHPLAKIDEIPWVPRDRYRVMREVLGRRGALAHHMMKATGSVQANYDYADESDLARKLRVTTAASPVVTALYANSSISEGAPNGLACRRAWIWRHTDPDRCGVLPFVFDPQWLEGGAYRSYAEWALDVPMLFIQRDESHISVEGRTFRWFMNEGYGEHRATLADWNLHLTTLFPEVRLKRVLEVRSSDAVPPGLVCAMPAFWKGILYDAEALDAAEARLRHWRFVDVDRLYTEVARSGLDARTPDGPLLGVAQELVALAGKGLQRIGSRNNAGEDESLFLEPLHEILDRGKSPGQQLVERWDGSWQRKVERLIEYAAY
jgi:glutamate--cysteine ligase